MRRVLLILLIAFAAPAAAQAPRPAPRDDLARVEAEQQEREQLRDQQRSDAAEARREIAELTAQLAELNRAQDQGEATVSEKRLSLAALNAREAQLSARAGANQAQLARLLGALQIYSRSPPPALFVNPRDARDAVRAAILIRAAAPELERRAQVYAAEAAEARALRRKAAAQSAGLFADESSVADRAARIESLLAEKTALDKSLTADASAADKEIAVLAARAAALRVVVGRLPPAPPRAAKPLVRMIAPVVGAPEKSAEAWSWRPSSGASVIAPAAGIVEYAGPVFGWKTVVILGAGGDHHIVLAGLDTTSVRRGQSVTAGQTIGRMVRAGNMGLRSEPSELRLEIRKDGQPTDPARFMQNR